MEVVDRESLAGILCGKLNRIALCLGANTGASALGGKNGVEKLAIW
jgi:hypothetical protein